jgi:hypothetical protein
MCPGLSVEVRKQGEHVATFEPEKKFRSLYKKTTANGVGDKDSTVRRHYPLAIVMPRNNSLTCSTIF